MAPTIALRHFRSDDLNALYAISLATGHEGGDASHLYEDPRLIGHIYAAPYALLEPGLALVAEIDGAVAGFAVGTLDTALWEESLELNWWPGLRRQYLDPDGTPPATRMPDQRRAHMIHHPERTPPAVVSGFPAHLHLNLLPKIQGRGVGPLLLSAWFDLVPSGGVAAHVGVNHANDRAIRFWARQGFETLRPEADRASRTVWMGRVQV